MNIEVQKISETKDASGKVREKWKWKVTTPDGPIHGMADSSQKAWKDARKEARRAAR